MSAMDNKINLNFYGVNYRKAVQDKKEAEVKEEEKTAQNQQGKNVAADEVLNAMALSGKQNVAFAGINAINPKDYLDEASIARIQNSMTTFGNKVADYLEAVENEFPNLPDAQKQALAYQAVLNDV